MADARFFIDGLSPEGVDPAELRLVIAPSEDLHHMANVLRLSPGERIELVTRGDWRGYDATVVSVERGSTPAVAVSDVTAREQFVAPYDVTLAFGIAKGDKTDTIVRQAVELGVSRLIPVTFDRSIVRLAGDKVEKRQARLQSIAEAAAKQSHHSIVPEVSAPSTVGELAVSVRDVDIALVAWEETSDHELSLVLADSLRATSGQSEAVRIMVVVGPEGGISSAEMDVLAEAGATSVSLGPTILRVDTACAVALGVAFDTLRRSSKSLS